MPTREEVFKVIDDERAYQDKTWPRSQDLSVLGEITLARQYLRQFEDHYQEDDNAPGHDVPPACMHDLRKITTILVRAMEHNGAPFRNGG